MNMLQSSLSRRQKIFLWFSSVILPLYALGLELKLRLCATTFFNPIPTGVHILLVTLVAVSSALSLRALKRNVVNHPMVLGCLQGMAFVTTLIYTLMFIPIMPKAALAVGMSIFTGGLLFFFGIPAFAPAFSLFGTMWMIRTMRHFSPKVKMSMSAGRLLGGGLAVVFLLSVELRATLTIVGLEEMQEHQQSVKTLRDLRLFGDLDIVRDFALENVTRPSTFYFTARSYFIGPEKTWLMGGSGQQFSVTPETAKQVYFEMTGEDVTRASSREHSENFETLFGRMDSGVGGREILGRSNDVELTRSEIHGSIDAAAAFSYLEWSMEFRNSTRMEQEARAEIELPPGAVVSRATIWVNGEEQEAAFAKKATAIAAYDSVVRARRDPLLVTQNGDGRVFVQCYPIPTDGKIMKIRLGITSPLQLAQDKEERQFLPTLVAHNFMISSRMPHEVWLEATVPLIAQGTELTEEHFSEHGYALRGQIKNLDNVVVAVDEKFAEKNVFSPNPIEPGVVTQTLVELAPHPDSQFVFIVDGGAGVKEHRGAITSLMESALSKLSPNTQVSIIVAENQAPKVLGAANLSGMNIGTILRTVAQFPFQAGGDNGRALEKAWDLVSGSPESTIVWFHAAQPVAYPSFDSFHMRYLRRLTGPRVVSISLDGETDITAKVFDDVREFEVHQVREFLDKGNFLSVLNIQPRVERRYESTLATPNAVQTSDHLVRLWAASQVAVMIQERKPELREQATERAAKYGILSTVSSAVALESADEMRWHGLDARRGGFIPIVPEADGSAMLLAVLCSSGLLLVYQRRIHAMRFVFQKCFAKRRS